MGFIPLFWYYASRTFMHIDGEVGHAGESRPGQGWQGPRGNIICWVCTAKGLDQKTTHSSLRRGRALGCLHPAFPTWHLLWAPLSSRGRGGPEDWYLTRGLMSVLPAFRTLLSGSVTVGP